MAAIGTWAFSYPAVRQMKDLILSGEHATDVVERAVAGEAGLVAPAQNRLKLSFPGFVI